MIFALVSTLVYAVVRKKLSILYSIGLGTIITLATYFYQVKPHITDISLVNHGFPHSWLDETWLYSGGPHRFSVFWGGLLLDILFWSIIAFIIIVMIKVSTKSRRSYA